MTFKTLAILWMILFGLVLLGCAPHRKHYRTKGQASHYLNCRKKCPAKTAWDWHERRR